MKLLSTIVLLLLCTFVNAQLSHEDSLKQAQMMRDAAAYLHGSSKPYRPEKAFELYMICAKQGNPKAMNAVAIQYAKGLGIDASISDALKWYEKAAHNGYVPAWVNLGVMYRSGLGIPIDYAKAYDYYKKAAQTDNVSGMYNQAYMLYKGLGCEQNYTKAFQLFQQGSLRGNIACMYFLGLCYRNGYGTAVKADSARYWLSLSASKGYDQSILELSIKEPENLDALSANTTSNISNKKVEGEPLHYKKTTHNVKAKDIDGNYTGYAIRYDWSGEHVISRSKVILQLKNNNGSISGQWVEDDTVKTALKATATEGALVFNNTGYSRKNHYSPVNAELFEFKNTELEMIKSKGIVSLAGTVQLYSPKRKEPGKPMYIILTKAEDKANSTAAASAEATNEADVEDTKVSSTATKLLAYPNPFNNNLTVEFTLKVPGNVRINLLGMEGKVVWLKELHQLQSGKQIQSFNVNTAAGAYMLVVMHDNIKESTLVIKNNH